MPTAVADQFSNVFGDRRGAQRTDEEEANLQQALRGDEAPPVFPFAEDAEVAHRRLCLVRWLMLRERGLQSVPAITRKFKVYGGESLIRRLFLIDWPTRLRREAVCRADLEALQAAGICRASYPSGGGDWSYRLMGSDEWPPGLGKEYWGWLATQPPWSRAGHA
jgi:hypothetical protein